MNKINTLPKEINIVGKLADLKEINYKNTLINTTLVELLIEKGIISRQEFIEKMKELDNIY